jgi:hypothetical protein
LVRAEQELQDAELARQLQSMMNEDDADVDASGKRGKKGFFSMGKSLFGMSKDR